MDWTPPEGTPHQRLCDCADQIVLALTRTGGLYLTPLELSRFEELAPFTLTEINDATLFLVRCGITEPLPPKIKTR